jgi:hypothetical protein
MRNIVRVVVQLSVSASVSILANARLATHLPGNVGLSNDFFVGESGVFALDCGFDVTVLAVLKPVLLFP